MVLKFTQAGKFLMQIGKPGASKGSNDVENLKGAAKMYVDPKTNELYVADGYGNHRVIVFDAETGIDGVEPLFEERRQVVRVAARTSGAEKDPLDPAVDAVETEVEPSCSSSLLRQAGDEILNEPLGCAQQIGGVGNRLGKAQPHVAGRRFAQRLQRFRQIAQRLIELSHHRFAKTVSERIARHARRCRRRHRRRRRLYSRRVVSGH